MERNCATCSTSVHLCQCTTCALYLCSQHAQDHLSSTSHYSLDIYGLESSARHLICSLCGKNDVRGLVACEKGQEEIVIMCKKGCLVRVGSRKFPGENEKGVIDENLINKSCFERQITGIGKPVLRFVLKEQNQTREKQISEAKSRSSSESEAKDTLPAPISSPKPAAPRQVEEEFKPSPQAAVFSPPNPKTKSSPSKRPQKPKEESKSPALPSITESLTSPNPRGRPTPAPARRAEISDFDDLEPYSYTSPSVVEIPGNVRTDAIVPDRFEDEDQYVDVFFKLLEMEVTEERKQMAQLKDKYTIRWHQDQKIVGEVIIGVQLEELTPGDDLKITDFKGNSAVVTIHDINQEMEWVGFKGNVGSLYIDYDAQMIGLGNVDDSDLADVMKYTVEFWESGSIKRMKEGLRVFHNGRGVVRQTADWILGLEQPTVNESKLPVVKPEGVLLNKYQEEAIQYALANELALIQGPPGTGKTSTAAVIVYNMWYKAQEQILVCAPSNIAVDQLALSVARFEGIKVLRIYGKSRINLGEMLPAEELSLHRKVRLYLKDKYPHTKDGFLDMTFPVEQLLLRLKVSDDIEAIEQEIIEEHHVICCTCAMSTTKKIASRRFKFLLVDEAGFSAEPETLLPILKGCEHFILVGDHMQLPPVVKSKDALRCRYGRSMFERLIDIGIQAKMLQMQYRMHPALSVFPSRQFYGGKLKDGIQARDRILQEIRDFWPGASKPMAFYDIKGTEERYGQSHSYFNHEEAELIEHLLYDLLQHAIHPTSIGIITPYEGQRRYLLEYIENRGRCDITDVEIKNIDGFQGREKDLILISCVRSNAVQEIGFLTEERRLNVAITRAKFGLIMVGNVGVLRSGKFWRGLIGEFNQNRSVRDGDGQLEEFRLG